MLTRLRGFTLPEMLLALSAGSLMLLSIAKIWPQLRVQSLLPLRQHQLEQSLQQAAQQIIKDLRRAGFCAGSCRQSGLQLAAYPGEAARSCALVSYDLDRSGKIESGTTAESEWFGYRLRQRSLESQRGVMECGGQGWERLLDQQEILVQEFQLAIARQAGQPVRITLLITAQWRHWPQIQYRLQRQLLAEDLQ